MAKIIMCTIRSGADFGQNHPAPLAFFARCNIRYNLNTSHIFQTESICRTFTRGQGDGGSNRDLGQVHIS